MTVFYLVGLRKWLEIIHQYCKINNDFDHGSKHSYLFLVSSDAKNTIKTKNNFNHKQPPQNT